MLYDDAEKKWKYVDHKYEIYQLAAGFPSAFDTPGIAMASVVVNQR